jgi:hypothetical protein
MWWRKKEDDQSYKLASENIKLQQKVNELQSKVEIYEKRIDGDVHNSSFSVDWDAMKVFSIERNWNNGFPNTILGYMLSEPSIHTEEKVTYKDVVREWTFQCSAEKHEQLVKEFNVWKEKK